MKGKKASRNPMRNRIDCEQAQGLRCAQFADAVYILEKSTLIRALPELRPEIKSAIEDNLAAWKPMVWKWSPIRVDSNVKILAVNFDASVSRRLQRRLGNKSEIPSRIDSHRADY